jgi:hypothetical protein
MSRYLLIRGLRWPLFVVLAGVNGLLAEKGILYWSQSWPFYLILAGVLLLAERAALAAEGYQPYPYPQGPGMNPGANAGTPIEGAAPTSTSPVAPQPGWQEFDDKKEGGQP